MADGVQNLPIINRILVESRHSIPHSLVLLSLNSEFQYKIIIILCIFLDKHRKMVEAARNAHTVENNHVQKSGKGNSLPEMNAITRLMIEQNRDSPSFSGTPGARHAETVIGIYCRLVHTFVVSRFRKIIYIVKIEIAVINK